MAPRKEKAAADQGRLARMQYKISPSMADGDLAGSAMIIDYLSITPAMATAKRLADSSHRQTEVRSI